MMTKIKYFFSFLVVTALEITLFTQYMFAAPPPPGGGGGPVTPGTPDDDAPTTSIDLYLYVLFTIAFLLIFFYSYKKRKSIEVIK